MGSAARDYVPLLRAAGRFSYMAGKLFGIKEWAFDEKAEKAHEYRRKQQFYINKMIGDLKDRLAAGDKTPSILGNILRQGLLKDQEILLASYTGSMSFVLCHFAKPHQLLTALHQSLLASTLVTHSLGLSATSPTGPICSRTALKLSVRYTTLNHQGPANSTVSDTSRLCIPLVTLIT